MRLRIGSSVVARRRAALLTMFLRARTLLQIGVMTDYEVILNVRLENMRPSGRM